MNHNYFYAIAERFAPSESQVAIDDLVEGDDAQQYTCDDLSAATLRYLHRMRELNVQAGDRVVVQD